MCIRDSHSAIRLVVVAPVLVDPTVRPQGVGDVGAVSYTHLFIAEWALPTIGDYDLSTVRTGIMAGSPCPASMMTKLIDAGIDEMTICYGMTETSPVSTQTRTDDSFDQKVNTVGRAGPHLEIKIVDPVSGETLPRGVPGEFMLSLIHI